MSEMLAPSTDRRAQRTRAAILAAFRALFFERGYVALNIQAVVAKANVGRSTFYKHFRDKEQLLVQSMQSFLATMADAGVNSIEPAGLAPLMQHFWDNRHQARVVFSGQSLPLILRSLAEQIEARLDISSAAGSSIPKSLIAAQVAHAQIALLDHWLRGRGASNPLDIASALHRSSGALLDSYRLTAGADAGANAF